MNEKRLKARKIFLEFQNDKDKSKALNVTTMTKKKSCGDESSIIPINSILGCQSQEIHNFDNIMRDKIILE
jgi:hypothetical protein